MFEVTGNTGVTEALFVSIPESIGLLAFGLGLIGAAVTIRWFFGRAEQRKKDVAPAAEVEVTR
jgi:hypothetical protein